MCITYDIYSATSIISNFCELRVLVQTPCKYCLFKQHEKLLGGLAWVSMSYDSVMVPSDAMSFDENIYQWIIFHNIMCRKYLDTEQSIRTVKTSWLWLWRSPFDKTCLIPQASNVQDQTTYVRTNYFVLLQFTSIVVRWAEKDTELFKCGQANLSMQIYYWSYCYLTWIVLPFTGLSLPATSRKHTYIILTPLNPTFI